LHKQTPCLNHLAVVPGDLATLEHQQLAIAPKAAVVGRALRARAPPTA
jgi:hypothetical protein